MATSPAFLAAMAEDDTVSEIADIQHRLNISAGSAQQTRARLISHGVVAPAGRGKLQLQLPYLREHLRGEL